MPSDAEVKRHILKQGRQLRAFLQYYRDGNLWYRSESGFEFPVPIEDTRGGTFHRDMKASYLMRWIRKHLETIEEGAAGE